MLIWSIRKGPEFYFVFDFNIISTSKIKNFLFFYLLKQLVKLSYMTIHIQCYDSKNYYFVIFICYLAALGLTLGHYRGNNPTHLILITAFYQFSTWQSPSYLGWVFRPSGEPSGVWTRNHPFRSQRLNSKSHYEI